MHENQVQSYTMLQRWITWNSNAIRWKILKQIRIEHDKWLQILLLDPFLFLNVQWKLIVKEHGHPDWIRLLTSKLFDGKFELIDNYKRLSKGCQCCLWIWDLYYSHMYKENQSYQAKIEICWCTLTNRCFASNATNRGCQWSFWNHSYSWMYIKWKWTDDKWSGNLS